VWLASLRPLVAREGEQTGQLGVAELEVPPIIVNEMVQLVHDGIEWSCVIKRV
jgi:hypothetical protein